jgi:hypothetical protein
MTGRPQCIAAGRVPWEELHEHFKHWLAVANALAAMREEAMDVAHANQPQGPHYRRAFNAIIKERESWVAGINDSTRAHCYCLVDNLAAVQVWRKLASYRPWAHVSSKRCRNNPRNRRRAYPVYA